MIKNPLKKSKKDQLQDLIILIVCAIAGFFLVGLFTEELAYKIAGVILLPVCYLLIKKFWFWIKLF